MRALRILFLLVLLAAFGEFGFGQVDETASVVRAENGCEMNSANADMVANVLKSEGNARVFLIAHAGSGESRAVNEKRLRLVRAFLTLRKKWDIYKPVYALGDPVKGQGKIDVFVGSKLYWVIMALKNEGPCMDCCAFDRLTWPRSLVKASRKKPRKSIDGR